jgi:hypothetical protein
MAFTVPTIEPPQPLGLLAGDWIQASSMNSLVQRDRFVFATRRRLLASLPKVVTTASASYQTAYGFQAKTLPTATDTILIGVTASDDCNVRVSTSYGNVTLTTGGPGCIIGSLTGVPIATWFGITVEVVSGTGAPVTIYGINIQEQILTAADLP